MSNGNNLSNFTNLDIICLQKNISCYYNLTVVTGKIPNSCVFKYHYEFLKYVMHLATYLEDTHNIISYKLPMTNLEKIPHE